jgi:hypothetical protein
MLSETTTESKFEQAVRLGYKMTGSNLRIFKKKYICILQCENCGKLKRFVEEI